MKFALTTKDIITLNQTYDSGTIINGTSLDFALSYAHRTENWTKALAYIVRAILLDHVFEEDNKRTALLLVKTYAEMEGHRTIDEKLSALIKKVILKNVSSIIRIEDMIKDGIQ